MATVELTVAMVLLAMLVKMVVGGNHTVGAPVGSWDMSTSLNAWASFQTFNPGDTLVFNYIPIVHDVVEVTKSDYDSCQVTNPISSHNDGYTAISLNSIGMRYFICGVPGHCNLGMKIVIETVAPGTRQHPFALSPAGLPGSTSSDTPSGATSTGNPSVTTGTLGYSRSPPAPTYSSSAPMFAAELRFVATVILVLASSLGF